MIDKRIGKRIKECREQLGLTQEEFAEKVNLTPNYISTVERGASFPRCEKLIAILQGLEVSADAIFCDVAPAAGNYRENYISQKLERLPENDKKRILDMLELMILQAESNN